MRRFGLGHRLTDVLGTRVLGGLLLTHLATAGSAQAREPDVPDGVYGRFEGDLELGLGFGAELAAGGVRAASRLSAHYYSMIGAYVTYRDALYLDAAPERTLGVGTDLRPMFIPRWSEDLQRGPAWLDLTVDSLSLGLGAFWEDAADGAFGTRRGFEASLGLAVPLFGTARGLWVAARGGLRWPEGPGEPGPTAVTALTLTLEWHDQWETALSDSAHDG